MNLDIITIIGLFTFIALWIFLAIYIMRGFFVDTPYYPSRLKQIDEAWAALELPSDGKNFVDLGSGDGRTVLWASKRGMKATGIELNPYLNLLARLRNVFNPKKDLVSFKNENFLKTDLKDYDIVYLYIYRSFMNKLKDKLFTELKPGSIIVSNVFGFDEIEPDETYKRFKIYRIK
ncbi:class I SAM-dependent methyltransferase [Candidatus Dojkabacteria bacterium]|uniref:Class I SAM-dependent methyltransferase n=1 Tax=Candidatus Dojkabacteria bacterium TaxID=2099670 RepID=A0A955RH80_9BACT|nr:class I SAM-dependent methyltransferase [Candidatus Dojkabacteria bacterium]